MKLLTAIQKTISRVFAWSSWGWVVTFLLLPGIVVGQESSDGLKGVRVRMVNGSSVRASINSIDPEGNIRGSAILGGVTLDQLISIDTGRSATSAQDEPYVVLKFGGRQPFSSLVSADELLQVESISSSSRAFPLELVDAIHFFDSETTKQAMETRTSDADSVVVRTSRGEQIVRGLIEGIDQTHVMLSYGGKTRKIALNKVRAIVMAKLSVKPPGGIAAKIDLIDGSTFVGAIDRLDQAKLSFALSQNYRMPIPCAEIQKISIQSDSVTYLSDLEPIRFEEQTQFAARRSWRRDRSVLGNPLQLKFYSTGRTLKFEKGIGTRSYSTLVFANEGFDTFHAVVGIDIETAGHGDCEMVVTGDGIRLWSQRVLAGDDPSTIKVDIQGINEVALTVFPGEKFDLADHANWADARFTKN